MVGQSNDTYLTPGNISMYVKIQSLNTKFNLSGSCQTPTVSPGNVLEICCQKNTTLLISFTKNSCQNSALCISHIAARISFSSSFLYLYCLVGHLFSKQTSRLGKESPHGASCFQRWLAPAQYWLPGGGNPIKGPECSAPLLSPLPDPKALAASAKGLWLYVLQGEESRRVLCSDRELVRRVQIKINGVHRCQTSLSREAIRHQVYHRWT